MVDLAAPGQPRAYIRRRGRLTAGQTRARETLGQFCVADVNELRSPESIFGRHAPLGLEIGFGMGQALLEWATARPDWNLLGLEIYAPGTGALLLGIERLGLANLRALEVHAEVALQEGLLPASLDEVRIFFPDPWPKARHHKRRLIQPAFVALLAERLRPGGRLWLATDWAPYAEWMQTVLGGEPRLLADTAPGTSRVETRFEARGRRLGHGITDLVYRRTAD